MVIVSESKVFIPQYPMRRDPNGTLVPAFDLSPAKDFGEIVRLLSASASPFGNTDSIVAEMTSELVDYQEEDYILAAGNPCFIGAAVAIAANMNDGGVQILQWNKYKQEYSVIKMQLW